MLFFLASADTRSQGTGVIDHARRFPPPWTSYYFSILIVRVVVAPHFLQV
jgi:hypothetical protein